MRPTLRWLLVSRRLLAAVALALGLVNAMPLGARADDITLTQTVTGLTNTLLNVGIGSGGSGGGGGGCSSFAYVVNSTDATPTQGDGTTLANGHEYAASVTVTNVGSCTWDMSHVVLAAQSAPSNWWDMRNGTAWRNSGQIGTSSGAVGQYSSVTFKFNLLPNGDVQPGSAGWSAIKQQVLFFLQDTSNGAVATCEGGCSSGYIAVNALMGNFHARLDSVGSAQALIAPVVLQQGATTSVTLAFRNTGSAPWLLTDSTNLEDTAVRLGFYDPGNVWGWCSPFADATWPALPDRGHSNCTDAAYVTQKAEPCNLNVTSIVSSGDPFAACTGDVPGEPNYSSFTFDLHASFTQPTGTYSQCFWPRVDVTNLVGNLGSAVGSMTPDGDETKGACITIIVV